MRVSRPAQSSVQKSRENEVMAGLTTPMTPKDQANRTPERVLVLEPGRAERNYWRDLWLYRELFITLAWRDVAVHYKQTVIGIAWAVVRPLLTMLIFTVVFGRLAKLRSDGAVPYPVLVMAGMLPWMLFSTILNEGSNSIVSSANLISKVYFPRLIVPCASAVVALVDFGISFVLLVLMMFWFGVRPDLRILFLPLFILLAMLASLGPALYIAALNVRYRDFRFVIPFIMQLGMYVSPVGFSSARVPEKWRLLYSLNPTVGVIDGFRWCLLGGQSHLSVPSFCLGTAVTGVLLWLGISYFRKTERSFADLV
ncbi:ABC-2 type transporter [Candidatus Sulfotelmatobacter kueseliae]|uniref:Transport permease protein n=1 Tax=Candidatus Sulfotelmatobacter kueseliae TaxID=2042962 RepID=A0A2U3L1Y6_9BACT|nr:ABC-2 type transporter [Candidatus Sulfotelmatobacter kueseliae]